jgi:hypothetical protein
MPPSPESHEPRDRRGGLVAIGALGVLAALSLGQGLRKAGANSQDFQWSGVRMLFARIDPWAEALRGDPLHLIHLSQIPNYLPILYVLLTPFGFLPMGPASIVWALLNVAFAVSSSWIAARFYGLGPRMAIAVACLVFMASPTRQTIGNGQHGLIILFLWSLSLLAVRLTDARAAIAGVSYLKFNFAPPLFLYLLLEGGVRAVIFSLLPSAVATVLVWLWITHGRDPHELISILTGPFAVAKYGYFPSGGDPNLMDVLQAPLSRSYQAGTFMSNIPLPTWVNATTLASALAICFAVIFVAHRRAPRAIGWHVALIATMSVTLFKHHPYDGVVLTIPLCYALHHWRRTAGKAAVFGVAYAWYLQKGVEYITWWHFHPLWKYTFFVEFAALILLLCATWRLGATQALPPEAVPSTI